MSHDHLELSKWSHELTEIQNAIDRYFGSANSQVISIVTLTVLVVSEPQRLTMTLVLSVPYLQLQSFAKILAATIYQYINISGALWVIK